MTAADLPFWLQKPLAEFTAALGEGRLPGSVIFSCPAGMGSESLAFAAAKAFLCLDSRQGRPCLKCRSCELMDAGTHPDYIRIRATDAAASRDGLDITHDPFDQEAPKAAQRFVRIAALRQMSHFLSESPALGGRKCAVIQEAELMREDAASAVLKTFEEPPKGTLIIMMASNLDVMLPTMLSRAFKIPVPVPPRKEAAEFVKKAMPDSDPAAAGLALALASGAPYGALDLMRAGADAPAPIDGIMEALKAFGGAICGKGRTEDAVNALLAVPGDLMVRTLSEFVLEDLKYKAGVAIGQLPLLSLLPYQKAAMLGASHLMRAMEGLRGMAGAPPLLPPRAPAALVRSWIEALGGTEAR
jgi:DNA polymerase-3 subunit delta'